MGTRPDRFRGALVGVAVGDALGAPFEGQRGPISLQEIDRVADTSSAWRITDDTVMTIGLAESLLFRRGLDQDHLAGTFAAVYARDPFRGYGAGVASLLQRIAGGEDWRTAAPAQFQGQGSFGNGAAMRVASIGLYAAGDPGHAARLARRSASVTHTHPLGVAGAAAQAAAIATLVDQPYGRVVHVPQLVATLCNVAPEPELCAALELAAEVAPNATASQIAQVLGTGVAAVQAVPAALCAFLGHQDSFAEAVRFAISLGGDTDTIASMAGALAGAHLGYDAIPDGWIQRTERAPKLREIADRFAHHDHTH